jgi:acyl-CoA synthetase (AMP-forming)/AMP-acid ligase II
MARLTIALSNYAEGFFWFAGRCKEIIVHGGANVSPREQITAAAALTR